MSEDGLEDARMGMSLLYSLINNEDGGLMEDEI